MSDTIDAAPFINLADPALSIRSAPIKEARAKSWYARTPYGIAVLRYPDMRNLILDKSLRQGSHAWPAHNDVTGVFADWWGRTMLVKEGADHARLRRLVNPAFAPRLVEAMRPAFEATAAEIANGFAHRGECDFMAEFANPYASRILCYLLGLPLEEAGHLHNLSADMGLALGVAFKENAARVDAATEGMFAYADALVAKRRTARGDDFMSMLVSANEDNDRLSDEELRDMILLLIMAGIDTTRSQLGLGIAMFCDHPEQWALLAEKPELAPKAVEEIMRLRPTITWVTREAVRDFEYNGLAIKAGTTLHLISEAAGTDPDVYAPGFDITAERARHFGFGGGIHHCLGHAVARSDLAVALTVLPPKLKNLRLGEGATWLPDSGNTGAVALPIRFDPAS